MSTPAAGEIPEAKKWLFEGEAPPLPRGIWGRIPALTYVLPFAIYMLFTSLVESRIETKKQAYDPGGTMGPPLTFEEKPASEWTRKEVEEREEIHARLPYRFYAKVYALKIACTLAAMVFVLPGYWVFPFRISGVALLVGVVGAVLWIGLCKLHLERTLLGPLGLGALVDLGERPGFNPMQELSDDPAWANTFMAIRLLGLIVIVPIIEEFFLRVFLIRFVMDVDWFKIPFGRVDRLGLITSVAFPMLMHPSELFAAFVWFSMVTWLMLRTRNIWDCVVAHMITNGLIGAWVIWSGDWWLM